MATEVRKYVDFKVWAARKGFMWFSRQGGTPGSPSTERDVVPLGCHWCRVTGGCS